METVNTLTKRVQKYKNYETHLAALKGNFDIAQLKYDGWWGRIVFTDTQALIYSRTEVLKETREHNKPCLAGTVLLGEFMKGTSRCTGVSGESAHVGKVMVFDILSFDSEEIIDLSYDDRMRVFRDEVLSEGIDWVGEAISMRNLTPFSINRMWNKFVTGQSYEGLVFRNSKDPYLGATIGRVKETFTMDYVIMSVIEGAGKRKGKVGALQGGLFVNGELVEKTKIGGGFNDEEGAYIFANPAEFIGRVLEVKGYQIFESGAMRHGNAERGSDGEIKWRDDKPVEECVWHK